MRASAALATLAALAVALAGCSGGGGKGGKDDDGPAGGGGVPMLQGWVVDPAIRPIPGATVKVLDSNTSVLADDGGHYAFAELPTDQFLVIVVSKDGFLPQPKQVTLAPDTPLRLNFTLEPEPIAAPYVSPLTFEGFIGCQLATVTPTGNNSMDCSGGVGVQQNKNMFDFPVEKQLAGAVIELYWEPVTEAANTLGLRVETLELGQLNVVLGEAVGSSSLRIPISQTVAEKYYPQGGLMRLTVFAASDGEENEAGLGYSMPVRQQFKAFMTLFYIDPPPADYTVGQA